MPVKAFIGSTRPAFPSRSLANWIWIKLRKWRKNRHNALYYMSLRLPSRQGISATGVKELDRPGILLPSKVLREQAIEDRTRLGDRGEQGRTRAELHVVRRAEDLTRRLALDGQRRLRTLDEPRPEHGMGEVRARLVEALDRVALRRRAEPEAGDLGKDEPHPVRALAAAPDLVQGRLVDRGLGTDETLEVVRIVRGTHRTLASRCASWIRR